MLIVHLFPAWAGVIPRGHYCGPSPKKRTCKKCGIIRSHKEAARWEERVSTAEKKKSQL